VSALTEHSVVLYVDVMQDIGCCESDVANGNVDVTVNIVRVADDGHITVSVNMYVVFIKLYILIYLRL